MLKSLHISNYALIEHLDLTLDEGFSVITGETGAGKSIILGALGLLQGNRADTKAIMTGAKKCVVEGEFDISGLDLKQLIDEADLDNDDNLLTIRREIAASGKNRTFVNDTPVTLNTLKDLSAKLIDIHSQHQNLLVGNESFIIDTIDSIADSHNILYEYQAAFKHWNASVRKLKELVAEAQRSQEEKDFLAFQLQQLEEAQLQAGELEELEEEQLALAHAEDIKAALWRAKGTLANDETDVASALRQAVAALQDAGEYLPNAEELANRLDSARIEVEDIVSEVENEADNVDYDPKRLEYVEDRIGLLYDLLKKHRLESVDELIAKAESMRQALDAIENADERIAEQEKTTHKAKAAMLEAAKRLTDARCKGATTIERELTGSLKNLGMPNVRIALQFSQRPQPDPTGLDAVQFLFSANKSVAPQDVAQTASGGEIARLMLSLKALIAQKQNMPTIIFDEIDTGVSGTMAEKMGQVMDTIAARAQVLCITHLPQIAALGAHHYRVFKEENDEGTHSHITALSDNERITEIANMLSGAQLTAEALANAKKLLRI